MYLDLCLLLLASKIGELYFWAVYVDLQVWLTAVCRCVDFKWSQFIWYLWDLNSVL